MTPASVQYDVKAQLFRVTGDMVFDTVVDLHRQALEAFATVEVLNIELQAVSMSDSAGLALLLEWTRTAMQLEKAIEFRHLPTQLLDIATVSGLEDILPIASATDASTP